MNRRSFFSTFALIPGLGWVKQDVEPLAIPILPTPVETGIVPMEYVGTISDNGIDWDVWDVECGPLYENKIVYHYGPRYVSLADEPEP